MTNKEYRPLLLIILDGWGISPSWGGNALAVNTPKNINRLWREYPHKVLQAFTLVAGKYGVVGDSRLGHSTIAAGRRIRQDMEIISEAIENRSFFKNKVLNGAVDHCQNNNSNLHLIGLLSNGGIHANLGHLKALIDFCHRKNFNRVCLDVFGDGIDSGAYDGINFVEEIEAKIAETGVGRVTSVIGRLFAMDRVGDFRKTIEAYNLLVNGLGRSVKSSAEAFSRAYRDSHNDFNLPPTIVGEKSSALSDNDAIIFFNFRSDRAHQLLKMLLGVGFHRIFWKPKKINNLKVVTLTKVQKDLPAEIAFPRAEVKGILGEIFAENRIRQLRLAESEKAAHVTTFFNGGREEAFAGESRQIIPSRKTANIAAYPQMATPFIADDIALEVGKHHFDFILVNLANADMISHTGDMLAAGRAISAVDQAVGKMVEANRRAGGATIISADHGNIEEMIKLNPHQDPETKHTLNPVPFIYITPDNKKNLIKTAVVADFFSLAKIITAKDTLADVAPTILEIMDLPKSKEMTGHSLLNRLE